MMPANSSRPAHPEAPAASLGVTYGGPEPDNGRTGDLWRVGEY